MFVLAHAIVLIKDHHAFLDTFFIAEVAALVAHVQLRCRAIAQCAGGILATFGVGEGQRLKCSWIGLTQRRLNRHLSAQVLAFA